MAFLCRILGVSRSGFYAWGKRGLCQRAREDARIKSRVIAIHRASRETYGSPRIYEELKLEGFRVSRKRIARLMQEMGITARLPRRFRKTTDSNHHLPVAQNVLARNFEVDGPNQVWVADISYVWTWEGWLYLAVILDLFSRRAVGWSMANHLRAELVLEALHMALGQRLPQGDLLHHSDRGSQYASSAYRKVLQTHGITCSMSRKGDCWDNAVMESFFGTLKTELIHRYPWPSRRETRSAIHEYLAVFYNSQRRHSYLGYLSPVEFEKLAQHRGILVA